MPFFGNEPDKDTPTSSSLKYSDWCRADEVRKSTDKDCIAPIFRKDAEAPSREIPVAGNDGKIKEGAIFNS